MQNPPLQRVLHRAFSNDPDCASSAIHQISRQYDLALAALAWSYFWVRQGDLIQARRELEKVAEAGQAAVRLHQPFGDAPAEGGDEVLDSDPNRWQ